MNSPMKDTIEKTREYLDYIEEHYDNVQKAFKIVEDKCSDMSIIYDDYKYHVLKSDVMLHDFSKLSDNEFVQYRVKFFPTKFEKDKSDEHIIFKDIIKDDFNKAWDNHKEQNNHHWQTWTTNQYYNPYIEEIDCTHMVIDWIAMGMKFNDTARNYYESNRDDIDIPDWAVDFIYEIFDRVYGEVE